MPSYIPKRVFFEQEALEYPMGKHLYKYFKNFGESEIGMLKSHNRVTEIPGKTPQECYTEGKNTLVVGVRKTLDFEKCKPSAHYQLPLVTGCIGKCEYCYLNTRLGKKPYLRIYVNIDEILYKAEQYIKQRLPETTIFEASATSDPIPVEPYTGALSKTIKFFANQDKGRLRFVTKFTDVDSLLDIPHNEHTTIRFSLNTQKIIKKYEHNTPNLIQRIKTSKKVIEAHYPIGYLIAPVITEKEWRRDYESLLQKLSEYLRDAKTKEIHFEIISHRFTKAAKRVILDVFPKTELPMDENERKFKYGQFGYGKYVYGKEELDEIKNFFHTKIKRYFPNCNIEYII